MRHFFDFTPESLTAFAIERGLPKYLTAQLLDWVYRKGVVDIAAMSNISKAAHAAIQRDAVVYQGQVLRHQVATDATQKLLVQWPLRVADPAAEHPERRLTIVTAGDPDRQTECVMIPTERRRTACISSQVGCPVGCRFCASGIGGLGGNLTAGQILEQVHRLSWLPNRKRVTHVVFMGMGEPLANLANVTSAIRTLHAPWGFGISARRITVSTVGLPAAIRKFVGFELPVTLALSLHAPNDEIRRQLIPWAHYSTIAELLDACDEYFRKTGREITLEYLLLRHVNDRAEHAHELAQLARQLRANVNLIRYNEVKGLPFDRPTTHDVLRFQSALRSHGVNAHIRASRGRDIAAACGQLRHDHQHQPALPAG